VDITMTIPQGESPEWVESFFNSPRDEGEDYFPFAATVRDVCPGDWLYVIYRGRIHGRLEILRVDYSGSSLPVGTLGETVNARTVVWVRCPGESAGDRNIPRDGHTQFHYDDVPEW
jgi:hypothetical protein